MRGHLGMSVPGTKSYRRAGAFASRSLRAPALEGLAGRARPQPVDATPLALFRILFGTCLFLEAVDLLRFRALFFDVVPFVIPGRIPITPALLLWMAAAIGIILGYKTRLCALVNYACVVVFLGFLAVPHGFEYHLDGIYLLVSFALLFLPVSRALSLDRLRAGAGEPRRDASPLAWIFLALVVSAIYFDSALWKLSSQMWLMGLGYWTPATQPWDALVSIPWTLENGVVAKTFGYVTLVFELAFPFLVFFRRLRLPVLGVAFALHVGIGTVIPLPRFGLIMIALLAGLLPPEWFDRSGRRRRVAGVAHESREPGEPFGASWPRRVRVAAIVIFFSVWGIAFAAGLSEPIAILGRYGVGGVDREFAPPPAVASESSWARAYRSGMDIGYRFFGFRSHPIFLDRQFCDYDVQTRLVYRRAGAIDGGERIDGAVRDRLFLPWTYRTVRPRLPLARVKAQLARYIAYWAQVRDLDLESGSVIVQQRPIEMPTDSWRAAQRSRNIAARWTDVGWTTGPVERLVLRWDEPIWR